MDVQITKWLHLSFLFSSRLGRGRRGLRVIHYTKKHKKKHRQPPSCIVKFLQILCSSCIRLILVILSCLRRRGRRYKRGSDITIFFPKHSYLFCYYHKMNLLYSFIISKILVYIFNSFFFYKPLKFNRKRLSHKLCYISGIFDNKLWWTFFLERDISMIFCGHRHIIITHCLTLA